MPPKKVCGNPLFLSWMEGALVCGISTEECRRQAGVEDGGERDRIVPRIEACTESYAELRADAQSKNLKSAESYGKACKSLYNCPVTYDRPRDLVCLVGIGAKTVDLLEKKWRAWCVENGRPIEVTPESTCMIMFATAQADRSERKRVTARPVSESPSPSDTESALNEIDQQQPKKTHKTKPKAKPKPPKAYIPAPRSGGYAILLALVLAIDQPEYNTQVYLTKSELSRAAQPYSDSSFTHSDKGSYYTAWNSMKTLVGKGYVYATGNPQKYCLTEEG